MEEVNRSDTSLNSSPWSNAYWFARMLINGDKYGQVGKNNKLMLDLAKNLQNVIENQSLTLNERVELSKASLRSIIADYYPNENKKSERIRLFVDDLSIMFRSINDIQVFMFTLVDVMIPINNSLEIIPSNDLQFTQTTSKEYLSAHGANGLPTVLKFWDDAGVKGSLSAERIEVVREFGYLRQKLAKFGDEAADQMLTAFVQEFERRLGQKRKKRAGGSLEDVTSFLFKFYDIDTTNAPDHFQADIEVDKWLRCKDKWLIAVSCKRTIRERWKQVSSANAETLSKYKIRQIWHLVTYDEDLSDDKITLLGSLRHVFYLSDESRIYLSAKEKIGLRNYVRPMSKFIEDLKTELTR